MDAALHLSSSNGHLEVTKLLLKRSADIMAKSNDEWTALHFASLNGPEVTKILLEKNVDIMATDKDRWTALHFSSEEGQLKLQSFF
jgi:ankyrin repeat protein